MGATERSPALAMRHLAKSFGGVRALDDASLEVAAGEVHGLVGQNGAGKSTLIKILAGLHAPDGGTIAVGGRPVAAMTPRRAAELGIGFIHQDRLLVPTFTVGEAIFLGHEGCSPRRPVIDRRSLQEQADALLECYFGVRLPAGALIGSLTTAEQQIVQITRALAREPRIIVLDEPTAALALREVEHLFAAIASIRRHGITTIYISHYLSEIEEICDRVTILRNGRNVDTVDPRRVPAARIAALMIDKDLKEMFPKAAVAPGAAAIELSGVAVRGRFEDVSLRVRRGEIVGITGLLGSGAKELVRSLFGLERLSAGEMRLGGVPFRPATPEAAVASGVALVPEDRRGQGVALDLGVRENTTLASLASFSRLGFLDVRRERQAVGRLIADLGIRTGGQEAAVRTLSGGNQQKVAIAKWLSRNAQVYVLDEPTVGVDIAAKVEIYRLIGRLAADGAAILMLSADVDELLGIANRVLVMYRGRIICDLATEQIDAEGLIATVLTGSPQAPSATAS